MISADSTQQTAHSKNKTAIVFLFIAVTAWGCGAKPGQAEQPHAGFAAPKEQPVSAELVTEHASIPPGGKTRVGVLFKIQEGWHIYYKDPGDAGLATAIAWAPFPGAIFGELQWPEPSHFTDSGNIHTNGYAKQVVLSNQLTLVTRETPDAVSLHAKVKWLACHEICLPGSAELDASLPVNSSAQTPSPYARFFPSTGT